MNNKNEKDKNEFSKYDDIGYEEAFSIMQDILYKLENGNIKLDESLKLYEEGIHLYRKCTKILDEASLKVSKFNEDNEEVDF